MLIKPLSQAIILASLTATAFADTPTIGEVLNASGISVTGYVDAAYTHFDTVKNLVPSDTINYFDHDHSTFDLKQVGITIASQPKEGFGALVNLTAGSDADQIHSIGGSSSNLDITQAFIQYATGPVTAMAGKFNTLAGAEVIAPTGNSNISHSIAFLNAIPFTHTGVRVAYTPVDILTLYAGVNNGWDQQKDQNTQKTVELGLSLTPNDIVSWTLQGYSGAENGIANVGTPTTHPALRTVIDTVLTVKPIADLSLVLNADAGKQEDPSGINTPTAKWSSIVGYVNYAFTSEWHSSLRYEVFDDKDGEKLGLVDLNDSTITNKKVKAATLTVGYAPTSHVELRGEVRQDRADNNVFVKGSNPTNKQNYLALEGYYKF